MSTRLQDSERSLRSIPLCGGGSYASWPFWCGADRLDDSLLHASNADGGDEFGSTVAIDGHRAIVGNRYENDPSPAQAKTGADGNGFGPPQTITTAVEEVLSVTIGNLDEDPDLEVVSAGEENIAWY